MIALSQLKIPEEEMARRQTGVQPEEKKEEVVGG
jgi:hypothetical protein